MGLTFDYKDDNPAQSKAWLFMYDAVITIKWTLTKTAGGGTVSSANNAPAVFFDSFSYDLNDKELDSGRNLGVVSTLRRYKSSLHRRMELP
ncbi:hypothetical protein JTB14_009357 [Gonioctena quinquepunctata]|nr:hypothetical protein JTB14_009357 [Gonioctena quinquepunctata]